jgi:beta-glucosidase
MMAMFPPPPAGPSGMSEPSSVPVEDGGPTSDDPGADEAPGVATFAPGGDRRSLRLSAADEALVRATVAACGRTVVAVMGGSAVVMPWLDEVPAVLQVWYPGMEGGGAFADVLTGVREPGGRLPFALPYDEADLVPWDPDADGVAYDLFHGQWKLDRDGVAPQRPFGAGLGYTTFAVDPGSMVVRRDAPGATTGSVEVEVENTGDRRGSTVVFAFAGLPGSTVERPVRRLVGFRRVTLGADERGTLSLPFDLATLAVRRDGAWFQEPGRYVVDVGTDAGPPLAWSPFDVPDDGGAT